MKHIALLFVLIPVFLFSQQDIPVFGQLTPNDLQMNSFPGDSDTSGIILFDRTVVTVGTNELYVILKKKVHVKIKVTDARKFNYGIIKIEYYAPRDGTETIENLRAITHNGKVQKSVMPGAIYEEKINKYWRQLVFTFPDIQDGSILEYTYELHTPYFSRFRGFSFMNVFPTVYSELHTEIPGNFIYTRALYGNRSLDINKAEIKRSCFHLPGFKVPGDCEVATYAMKNVPAFKEEDYMLSGENYIPSLVFELAQSVSLNGSKTNYATSWKNVDSRLKGERNFGGQLKLEKIFKDQIPAEILSEQNELDRAKAVYYWYLQKMNWNGDNPFLTDTDVKKAFENGVGNTSEINLGLANALNATDLDAKIILVSPRDKRMPSKEHPSYYGLGNPLVHLQIDNQTYLLDATEKWLSFALVPLRALNQYGRVIDFKKGSYWEDIHPFDKSMHYTNVQMELDADGQLFGTAQEAYGGFFGAEKRKNNMNVDPEQQISQKQQKTEHLNISNFSIENEKDLDKPYVEKYDFNYYKTLSGDKIYLNPFVMETLFSKNLFQQNQRFYPIDFGFPMITNYLISIELDDAYSVINLPENQRIALPNNDGDLSVVYDNSQENKINIRFNLRMNNYHFPKEAYQSLREFFAQIVKTQFETPIELSKK